MNPTSPPSRRLQLAIRNLYLWACHRLYNEFAWSYDPVSWLVSAGRWAAWRELALDYLLPGPVLEAGFGTGELLPALARRGYPAYGVDLSPAMQRIARRKLLRLGLASSVLRVRAPAQRLPFPDGHLAGIVSTFPAEYIFDPATVGEFARVLRGPHALTGPGDNVRAGRLVIGGLAISIDNPRLARFAPLFYGQPQEQRLARWLDVLSAAGFEPRTVLRPCRGAHVLLVIAGKAGARRPG